MRYRLSLAGLPLSGPGADIGATLDPNGDITDLREAAFIVQQGETMPLIGEAAAKAECAQRSPRGSRITLGLRVLRAAHLGGRANDPALLPVPRPAAGGGTLIQSLVPAIAETQPRIAISARVAGSV